VHEKLKIHQLIKFNTYYPITLLYDKCKSVDSIKSSSTQTEFNYLDDRTRDIDRQAALKIANISIGQNNKPRTNEDQQEIRVRMDQLLHILEVEASYDLPF